MKKKAMALVLALGLVTVGIVGGTMAWLTAEATEVKNVFTDSDINITLTETGLQNNKNSYKMIPGHPIAKDPKVKVVDGSEDCWLFVKITESTTPDLDAYICYAIAEGWQIVEPKDSEGKPIQDITSADEIVIGRKVLKGNGAEGFAILGKGEYTDNMGTDDVKDDWTVTWGENEVCVKPSVTKTMMDAIDGIHAQGNAASSEKGPTLTFKAYAVQLYTGAKNKDDTKVEFTADQAWAQANNIANP